MKIVKVNFSSRRGLIRRGVGGCLQMALRGSMADGRVAKSTKLAK